MEKKTKWTETAAVDGSKEVRLSKGDKTAVYHEVSAAAPLELKITGPVKLHLQVRFALASGVKGATKEKIWTQIDEKKAKKHKLSLKPSKKWKAEAGAVSARKVMTLKVGAGEHSVKIGLPKGSTKKLLVRVVSKPAKAKKTKSP